MTVLQDEATGSAGNSRNTTPGGDPLVIPAGALVSQGSTGSVAPTGITTSAQAPPVATIEAEEQVAPEDDDPVSSEGQNEIEVELLGAISAPKGEIEAVPGYDPSKVGARRKETAPLAAAGHLLDAWYSAYASPATRALVMDNPDLVRSHVEDVLGEDDRTEIGDTTVSPWKWVCSLIITSRDGHSWIGTGWLVGPHTVITAGHCVYMPASLVPARGGERILWHR
jgi:V8-like Glu-specific endopeptidase